MFGLGQINPVQLQTAIWCDISHGQFYVCSYCIPVSCLDIGNKCPTNPAAAVKVEELRPNRMPAPVALFLFLRPYRIYLLGYFLTYLLFEHSPS